MCQENQPDVLNESLCGFVADIVLSATLQLTVLTALSAGLTYSFAGLFSPMVAMALALPVLPILLWSGVVASNFLIDHSRGWLKEKTKMVEKKERIFDNAKPLYKISIIF
jgi:hypothetical protein